ncbi:MAG: L-2-amino-thiazoline-4-carboxylic acid hydrolase [Candidatus Marinimicrobia bacterium]|nr:L-2-amino-thiazoline-4-carboxylic acid hydrolase [Candidatus Neomarinimicrobiota bacterium]MBL7059600.1 L-2-amino-thiazoline-4-carboxylic acid hydrolase [Candidatus Neomarinimicrobiota bacterium]
MKKEQKKIRQLKRFLKHADQYLINEFGAKESPIVKEDIIQNYRNLIPHIPDVGGRKNRLYPYLIQSAWALSLYRALKKRGKSLEAINNLIQNSLKSSLYRIPVKIRHLIGRIRLSKWNIKKMKNAATTSQERKYIDDWVWDVVDSDGKTFDIGIDYSECALVKFMHTQEADELTPYLCETDYMVYKAFGIQLNRTKTLATGCDKCNFRMKLN